MADIGEVLALLADAQEHAAAGRMNDVQWLLEAAMDDLSELVQCEKLEPV